MAKSPRRTLPAAICPRPGKSHPRRAPIGRMTVGEESDTVAGSAEGSERAPSGEVPRRATRVRVPLAARGGPHGSGTDVGHVGARAEVGPDAGR